MKLNKSFLLPVILLTSCTATHSVSSGNNNSNNAGTSGLNAQNIANDSTSNLRRAAIDRNKFNEMPVRVKHLTPDSIPRP